MEGLIPEQIVPFPVIIILVYFAMELLKVVVSGWRCESKIKNLIPAFSTILGCVFAFLAFKFLPGILPEEVGTWTWVAVIVAGACSGASATCSNQYVKQFKEFFGSFKGVSDTKEEE